MGNAYGHYHHKPDGMYSTLISGPEAPAVSLADLKQHVEAREFTDDDALLTVYGAAATGLFDAAGQGYLGRALITQRWQLTLPMFPACGCIVLPVPVVQQVHTVTYYDGDNAEQSLATEAYSLIINGEFAEMRLVDGTSWPATYKRPDAVAVQYDAGYGDAASDIPEALRVAISITAAGFYEDRASADEIPKGVRQLVANYRLSRGYL